MARIAQLTPDTLTPEQRAVYATIGGNLTGPTGVWLRIPELAARAAALTNYLRDGRLDARLFELMTLAVARCWSAQYVFNAHRKPALEAGVSPEIVEAVRLGQPPPFAREDERLVYDLVIELTETRDLAQPTFERALAAFGLEGSVELITGIGAYTMIAMLGKSFGLLPADGSQPLP